ncbi:hypothetical protein E2C01_042103 [Portunus trituberculatus]|uniref:Uncharacterized protein n=1 Tax=Portunus trituberculatus TaxID=210409 RepID=A0A5B7FSH3_PORTR|nr:hypothetical protein [Portunus trituberculatus]
MFQSFPAFGKLAVLVICYQDGHRHTETLLDCQDKAYETALEIFLQQVNERIQSCETTVSDLTRSLEFTQNEVDELRDVVNQLKRDKEIAKEMIESFTEDLQTKTEDKGAGREECVPRRL